MRVVQEFREFAIQWNVIDLAVWVIIGTAFGKIISSLVEDIIMPTIGKLTGGLDFSNMYYNFGNPAVIGTLAEARRQWAVLAWGNFATIVINFMIVAFAIFIFVKVVNRAIPKKKTPVVSWPTDVELLTEIRDLLRKQSS